MKAMIYEGPRNLKVLEVEDFPLKNDEVRISALFSGISHGTEMNVYRGYAPFFRRKMDWDVRLFQNARESEKWNYPVRSCDPGVWYMGYANVGKVIETGSEIKNIRTGDIVYSHAPHQSQVIRKECDVIRLPDSIKPEHGIFFTNLMTTFNGILDTSIKLGDVVAVSGLGVLGQLTVQLAKLSGAFRVYGIDLLEKRNSAAAVNGADRVFNPQKYEDVALEIRKLTDNKGVDAVIEVSGNTRALKEAIRIAAPDTTITALGWYQGSCSDLDLSEEFHHNRVTIRSSWTAEIGPSIRHMWNNGRKEKMVLELLSKLSLDNLITHRIPYDSVAEAYRMIDSNPGDIIQMVLTY